MLSGYQPSFPQNEFFSGVSNRLNMNGFTIDSIAYTNYKFKELKYYSPLFIQVNLVLF